MCLAVLKNKVDASFSVPDFRASWSRNSDGTGIAYVENGRIVTEKVTGYTIKPHLELYYKHMHRPQFLLHHRMATHGEKTELNVHPFKVLSIDEGDPYDLVFAHNGVISMNHFSKEADKKLSDTHLFAIEYLTPLMRKYPDIIEHSVFQIMLHDFIGSGNKLVFLRSDTRNWIFNKSAGTEQNGCWLSNSHSTASNHNTKNYGKGHGVNRDNFMNYDNYGYSNEHEDYVEENGVWKRDWIGANKIKSKAEDLLSPIDVNSLMSEIDLYAGMPEKSIEEICVHDVHLAFDMINLLSTKEVDESLLNDKASVMAAKLYELLQGYAKKKAA